MAGWFQVLPSIASKRAKSVCRSGAVLTSHRAVSGPAARRRVRHPGRGSRARDTSCDLPVTHLERFPHPDARHAVAVREHHFAALTDVVAVRGVKRLRVERGRELEMCNAVRSRQPLQFDHEG